MGCVKPAVKNMWDIRCLLVRLTVLLSEAQWVDRVEPGGWSTLFVLPSLRVVEGEEGPVRGNASWGCR